MTFEEIYEKEKEKAGGSRPIEWMQGVAVAAIVSTETVYHWGLGWRTPSKSAACLVAKHLDIPAEQLFPKRGGEQ